MLLNIKKKDTSIPFDKFFKIIKPRYVYIKVTPDKSISNYNSSSIAKAIKNTYRSINKRIRIENKKLWVETNFKIAYIVDIRVDKIDFIFMVPEVYKSIIEEKIMELWPRATLSTLERLEQHSKNSEIYQLSYKNEDALSLSVDKRTKEPLNSILSTSSIMKDNDRVTLIYNFQPKNNFGWDERYNKTITKLKEFKSVSRDKESAAYIFNSFLNIVLSILDTFVYAISDFVGADTRKLNKVSFVESIMSSLKDRKDLSIETKKKKDLGVLDCQIAVISESLEEDRRINNAMAITQSFRSIDNDNELISKKVKKNINIEDYNFKNIDVNTVSTDECINFIQIPSRSMLKVFSNVEQINVTENPVPIELQTGYINIGTVKHKGSIQNAYLSNHKDISVMPLYIAGRQGSGKSTFFSNYATYAINNGESVVHIDFIKNCESSKDIEKVIDKDKYVVLDFSTEEGLQSLAYNEIKFTDKMTWFEKQQLANKKTSLTLELVNSINELGDPLSPKMERYLTACTDIIYLNENATFKDVINCLQDFRYRQKVINNIPKEIKGELEEEINTLLELNETYRLTKREADMKIVPEVIGTKDSKIEGILDRVTLLKRDFYLKKMFNKSPENNIDFVKAMEEGKAILIRMPQSKFKRYVKNVITTFILTKCWLACEQRGELHNEPRRCHIMIDEISQTPTAEKYMESLLTQTRKFRMKFVLTGQYLEQLNKETIYSLKGAGTSFMLLKGTIKEDFEYLKDEFNGDYDYEDLKEMEKYNSLNLIETTNGKVSFISKLPKPI